MFSILQGVIYDHGVFWMFSGLCLAAAFFTCLVVQETKGKTLDQISEMFGGPTPNTRRRQFADGTENELLSGAHRP